MQRFDVLKDGPFRYIHSTDTGELYATLFQKRDGKFIDENAEASSSGLTLRQWKAILARRWDQYGPRS